MRYPLIFVGVLALVAGTSRYVHRRTAERFCLGRRARVAFACVLIGGVVAMASTRLAEHAFPEALMRIVGTAGSIVVMASIAAAVLIRLIDAASAVTGFVRRLGATPASAVLLARLPVEATSSVAIASAVAASSPVEPGPLPRRDFLLRTATGGALAIGSTTALYGALFGRHDYQVTEIAVRIPGLPRSLDGYTIVQLSDVHIGLFVGEPELRAGLELTRRARPDLVVLTGDLVDYDDAYAPRLADWSRRLGETARHGVVAIPGNHDYFTGIDAVTGALRSGGAEVLRNASRRIGDAGGGFALVGVDDVYARKLHPSGGPDLDRALAGVDPELPRVVLCHNPVYFPSVAGRAALQLSGHTHGGQVNPLVRPADWLLPYGYVAGRYERDGSLLYVNRGFGTAGPPMRIGSPPEISRFVLVAA